MCATSLPVCVWSPESSLFFLAVLEWGCEKPAAVLLQTNSQVCRIFRLETEKDWDCFTKDMDKLEHRALEGGRKWKREAECQHGKETSHGVCNTFHQNECLRLLIQNCCVQVCQQTHTEAALVSPFVWLVSRLLVSHFYHSSPSISPHFCVSHQHLLPNTHQPSELVKGWESASHATVLALVCQVMLSVFSDCHLSSPLAVCWTPSSPCFSPSEPPFLLFSALLWVTEKVSGYFGARGPSHPLYEPEGRGADKKNHQLSCI